MFDMFLWYVRHVPLVCSTCSFDMFSMFLQYVQHAHNTCSSCKNYMYLHVLPHVPCSMCMFFSGGPPDLYQVFGDNISSSGASPHCCCGFPSNFNCIRRRHTYRIDFSNWPCAGEDVSWWYRENRNRLGPQRRRSKTISARGCTTTDEGRDSLWGRWSLWAQLFPSHSYLASVFPIDLPCMD